MFKKKILLTGSLLIFIVLNLIILQKELHIANAIEIKIKLRPVDPRSLMQGDYMRLRYDFSQLKMQGIPAKGFLKIALDENNFVSAVKLYEDEVLLNNEHLLFFTKKHYSDLHIASESFMFEEGKGAYYSRATHAILLLDKEGKTLLKDLYVPSPDQNKTQL